MRIVRNMVVSMRFVNSKCGVRFEKQSNAARRSPYLLELHTRGVYLGGTEPDKKSVKFELYYPTLKMALARTDRRRILGSSFESMARRVGCNSH